LYLPKEIKVKKNYQKKKFQKKFVHVVPQISPLCSVRLGSAVWHLLIQTSYIQKDPLDGAASFFRWPCYRSKICPGDELGEQMASTEDPRKRKIICSWWELNPDRPMQVRRSTSRPRVAQLWSICNIRLLTSLRS
jgi:hypothetical protein